MSGQVTQGKGKTMLYYFNTVMVFVLMFGVGQIAPFGQVTPMGMQVLGVFVGVLYGWCTVSLIWPSLLAFIAIGSTGYCTITEAFCMGFGDDIPLMIVAVYILAAYLEETGLSRYLANWFISRKIGEGRPWIFTILIFGAAFVMSALVSMFATIIILWGIFYKICDAIGEQRRGKYAAMVVSGIVIICSLTGFLFPFKPFSLIVLGLMEKALEAPVEVNFMTWTLYNLVLTISLFGAYLLVGRFVVRPDMTAVREAGQKFAHLRNEKMDGQQKISAVVLALFMLFLILPSLLPKEMPGVAWMNNAGIMGGVIICCIALTIIKGKNGQPMVHVPQLISKGVNWELIILIAATMPLCNALEAPEVGVLQTVIAALTQLFGDLTPTMFLVVFVALFLITTQFTHNLVLLLVFTPVLVKMGVGFGIEPLLVATLTYYTAMTAFLTPAASSNAALIFGNTEWVGTKNAYFWGAAILVIAFTVLIGIGIPLGRLMF